MKTTISRTLVVSRSHASKVQYLGRIVGGLIVSELTSDDI